MYGVFAAARRAVRGAGDQQPLADRFMHAAGRRLEAVDARLSQRRIFEFTLLADERFAYFTNAVAGVPLKALADNRTLKALLSDGYLRARKSAASCSHRRPWFVTSPWR